MLDFNPYQTLLFETFKRDGTAVNTPIWFVQEGETIYVSTAPESWKAKRLRRNPRARIAGADAAERPVTDWYDVTGRFIDGAEAARIYDALDRRYDGYFRRFDRESGVPRVIIALDSAD